MKKLRYALSIMLLLASATLQAHTAHAARMGRGAQGWWVGYQREVCRDGATLAWLWDQPSFDSARSTLRLWEGPTQTGRLIGLAPMLPSKHTKSVLFVIDENGTQQAADVYAIRDVGWWPLLTVGATLSIEDPALDVTLTTTVKDCLLSDAAAIGLDRGEPRTIGALELRSPTLAIPDDQLHYRLLALPVSGTLSLSNTLLTVGDTFTQLDINEGLLRYMPSNNAGIDDTFKYSLDGLVRISLSHDLSGNPVEADGASFNPKISGNGGVVAYVSTATNLDNTAADFGGDGDIFLWLGNNTTRRVSLKPDGTDPDNTSFSPSLSASGARIAFAAEATDLVATNRDCAASINDSSSHIYRRDADITLSEGLVFTTTLRQSVSTGVPPACQRGNSTSYSPAVAPDSSVAFLSGADNLITPTTDADGMVSDVFRHTLTNSTELLSQRPPLTNTFVGVNGFALAGAGLNERIAFAASDEFLLGDVNGYDDVFLQYTRGPRAGQTITASVGPSGAAANGASYRPDFSRDGRWLTFESEASNLATADTNNMRDIFVRDLTANTIRRVSTTSNGGDANQGSDSPHLSADGRWLTFVSTASNLVVGDTNNQTDVFVRDLQTDKTYLISQPLNGALTNGPSGLPAISDDGHHIVFDSVATNLVDSTNGAELSTDVDADVFIRYFDPERTVAIHTLSRFYLPLMRR